MSSMANNDLYLTSDEAPDAWGMTVMELAIFLSIYRARSSLRLEAICESLGTWFEHPLAVESIVQPVGRMVARRWLAPDGDRLRPTREGREVARPLLRGTVKMLDSGSELLQVALMMSVLGFAANELDGAGDGG
ncbi:hypothetical protein FHS96_005314 [Sphingomonas zeicaulis]|uniref:hypothetical protein n=1 Tax=Sphingomonas zeicaulis TaxID=1632740 RepID=UPI003D1E589A